MKRGNKQTFSKRVREQMLANGASEEEIERVIKAHYEYVQSSNALLSDLLRAEKRNRYSCVKEKEFATMPILYDEDE